MPQSAASATPPRPANAGSTSARRSTAIATVVSATWLLAAPGVVLIGMGGGAASSMASGQNVESLDFDSVQRGNAELERRGLMARKGFPESYDRRALHRFIADVKSGMPVVEAPHYSHLTYDIVPGETRQVRRPDILIVEGLNVLHHANEGKVERTADAETSPLRYPDHYQYDFNIADITEVWRRGSVIASWLLDLTAIALAEKPQLEGFSGRVSDSGEGRWTINAAVEEGVPVPVLSAALFQRFSSRGEADFANKILSAMRFQFGGHREK